MSKGYFISFEGVDGSGKSTQIAKLKDYLEDRGYSVVITREPGGTALSEKIRSILLDTDNGEMAPVTEALLYAASRAQHVTEVIAPALAEGKVVICDRFVDSSIAYQGYGRGLGDSVADINRYAVDGYMPDLTFLMRLRPDIGSGRISCRKQDRIEKEDSDFFSRVSDGYDELEKTSEGRIVGIDACAAVEDIQNEIRMHLDVFLAR